MLIYKSCYSSYIFFTLRELCQYVVPWSKGNRNSFTFAMLWKEKFSNLKCISSYYQVRDFCDFLSPVFCPHENPMVTKRSANFFDILLTDIVKMVFQIQLGALLGKNCLKIKYPRRTTHIEKSSFAVSFVLQSKMQRKAMILHNFLIFSVGKVVIWKQY